LKENFTVDIKAKTKDKPTPEVVFEFAAKEEANYIFMGYSGAKGRKK